MTFWITTFSKSTFLQISLFVLASVLDVQFVSATDLISLPNQEEVLQEPPECLMKVSVCAIQTSKGDKYKLKVGDSIVVMDWGTLLIRLDSQTVRLVSGTIWVQPNGLLVVETEFGKVKGSSGNFWVERRRNGASGRVNGRVGVIAVFGEVSLDLRGHEKPVILPQGFENWMGGVDSTGKSQVGIPTAIALEAHLNRWGRLYSGTRRAFEREVMIWRTTWSEAVEISSTLHREVMIKRQLALAEKKKTTDEIRRRRNEENRRLRALFRQKVFWE